MRGFAGINRSNTFRTATPNTPTRRSDKHKYLSRLVHELHIYAQVFNRPLDAGGASTWPPLAGDSLNALLAVLLDTEEFRTLAGG